MEVAPTFLKTLCTPGLSRPCRSSGKVLHRKLCEENSRQ